MRIFRLWLALWVVLSLFFEISPVVHAAVEPGSIEQRIADLEKEVALLKRLKEVQQEVDVKRTTETPITTAGNTGFAVKSADSNFQLKFRGQIQADGRYYFNDNTSAGSNQYLMRRVRPILEGTVYKYFDFRLMPDFGGGTTVLQDAWIDVKYFPQASVRFGKFKSPFSLERLQSDPYQFFSETSLASNLAPNRDVGIDLHGDFFDQALSYDAGIFNGVPDAGIADTDVHDDKEFVGRIFALPFKNTNSEVFNNLGIGFAGSVGTAHGTSTTTQLPTYRSAGQETIFGYTPASGTPVALGRRYRIGPQGYYYNGPFGLLGEFVLASQDVNKNGTQAKIDNKGWVAEASYLLTGENASYAGVIPRNNFDPRNGKWGAVELVSRFSWLTMDKDAFPNFANPLTSVRQAKAWGAGVNWYLNRNIKWVTDFEETFYNGGGITGGDRKGENALLTRMQLYF